MIAASILLICQRSKTTSLFRLKQSTGGQVRIIKTLLTSEEGIEIMRQINSRMDAPDVARSVNRYAAAILMPLTVFIEEARRIDRTQWRNLYPLAERFGVTISALRVRLEQFNLLYVDQKTNTLYSSREEAQGQGRLF